MAKEDERSLQRQGEHVSEETGMEIVPDPEIDDLIRLLSQSPRALTQEEYFDSIAKRQEAVNKHLLQGGTETLRRFFERIKQIETRRSIKLDLSRIEVSGKILSGLYLPGANLERLGFTESELTGADITAANVSEGVGNGAIMRGVIATGANFNSAVIPNVDMSGGRFVGCSFINTIMPNVIVDKDTNFTGCRFVGTYLGNTDLAVANTMGAIFRGVRR